MFLDEYEREVFFIVKYESDFFVYKFFNKLNSAMILSLDYGTKAFFELNLTPWGVNLETLLSPKVKSRQEVMDF